MNESFNNLATNPYVTLVGLILGAVGIALAIYFYFRQKKEKKPRFDSRSYEIIENLSNKINGIEITYGGNAIANLTITKIAFWNAGRETITKSDIPDKGSLEVVFDNDTEILDISVVHQTTEANNFLIAPVGDGDRCQFTFDYLDRDDYVIFQILHTGNTTTRSNIHLTGRIIGAGKVRRSYLTRPRAYFSDIIIPFVMLVCAMAALPIFPMLKDLAHIVIGIVVYFVVWGALSIISLKIIRKYLEREAHWREKFHKAF